MAYGTADASLLQQDYIDGRKRRMPWKSTKQAAWGNSPAGLAALGSMAKVHEFNEATKHKPGGFKSLPTRVRKRKHNAPPRYMGQTTGPGE